jgi:hypothetical protein
MIVNNNASEYLMGNLLLQFQFGNNTLFIHVKVTHSSKLGMVLQEHMPWKLEWAYRKRFCHFDTFSCLVMQCQDKRPSILFSHGL